MGGREGEREGESEGGIHIHPQSSVFTRISMTTNLDIV